MAYVEAYLDKISALPGETVRMRGSTDLRDACTISVIKEGATEEEVWRVEAVDIGEHPMPTWEQEPWRVGPGWPVVWEFRVPRDWKSGVYRIEVTARENNAGAMSRRSVVQAKHSLLLVVRSGDPGSGSKILFQLSTNTYWAYNNWGGKSSYSYNSRDKKQAHRLTLHRPGMGYMGGPTFSDWERQMLHWADREGIPLEFATNYDLHTWPREFDRYRLILSVGHDEYWSSGMRDHLEAFIAKGGNAAFFSGNAVCWQVRFEDGGATMVTYKENYLDDPYFKDGRFPLVSTLWSHPIIGRPENRLTGVGFPMGGYHRSHGVHLDGSGAYTLVRDDHWVLEGTSLKKGDSFGGAQTIVGYECDGCDYVVKDGCPVPTGKDGTPTNFTILAQAPAMWAKHNMAHAVFDDVNHRADGRATLGLYTNAAGGTVFTAGTTDWSHGLGKCPIVDAITRNLLSRLGK